MTQSNVKLYVFVVWIKDIVSNLYVYALNVMSPVHFKYIHDLHVHIFRNEIDRFLRIAFNGVSNWNRKPWDFHYLTLDVRSFVQNRWQINSLLNGVCIRNAHIFNCYSPAHSIDSDCLFSKKLNINHFQESKWEWKKIQFKLWITQSHSYNLSVLMLALATTFSEFNFDNSTDWLCCIIYWIFFLKFRMLAHFTL